MSSLRLPIVLVGPMGVGKTTVGKKLASALNVNFIDTDAEIVREHGPIAAIFEKYGEDHFREIEKNVLAQALSKLAVVATGGGAVLAPENREALSAVSCVYLSTSGRHQASRLSHGNRPLLKNGISDWKRIYDERKHFYQDVAALTIDTSEKSLKSIVDEILEATA